MRFVCYHLLNAYLLPTTRTHTLQDGCAEILSHPFFVGIDWKGLKAQQLPMPYVPKVKSDTDLSNFDQYESEHSDAEQWDQFLEGESQQVLDNVFSSG